MSSTKVREFRTSDRDPDRGRTPSIMASTELAGRVEELEGEKDKLRSEIQKLSLRVLASSTTARELRGEIQGLLKRNAWLVEEDGRLTDKVVHDWFQYVKDRKYWETHTRELEDGHAKELENKEAELALEKERVVGLEGEVQLLEKKNLWLVGEEDRLNDLVIDNWIDYDEECEGREQDVNELRVKHAEELASKEEACRSLLASKDDEVAKLKSELQLSQKKNSWLEKDNERLDDWVVDGWIEYDEEDIAMGEYLEELLEEHEKELASNEEAWRSLLALEKDEAAKLKLEHQKAVAELELQWQQKAAEKESEFNAKADELVGKVSQLSSGVQRLRDSRLGASSQPIPSTPPTLDEMLKAVNSTGIAKTASGSRTAPVSKKPEVPSGSQLDSSTSTDEDPTKPHSITVGVEEFIEEIHEVKTEYETAMARESVDTEEQTTLHQITDKMTNYLSFAVEWMTKLRNALTDRTTMYRQLKTAFDKHEILMARTSNQVDTLIAITETSSAKHKHESGLLRKGQDDLRKLNRDLLQKLKDEREQSKLKVNAKDDLGINTSDASHEVLKEKDELAKEQDSHKEHVRKLNAKHTSEQEKLLAQHEKECATLQKKIDEPVELRKQVERLKVENKKLNAHGVKARAVDVELLVKENDECKKGSAKAAQDIKKVKELLGVQESLSGSLQKQNDVIQAKYEDKLKEMEELLKAKTKLQNTIKLMAGEAEDEVASDTESMSELDLSIQTTQDHLHVLKVLRRTVRRLHDENGALRAEICAHLQKLDSDQAYIAVVAKSLKTCQLKVVELEADIEAKEPLLEIGVRIRQRFLEKIYRGNRREQRRNLQQYDPIFIERGNLAAHLKNRAADDTLYTLNYWSRLVHGHKFDKVYSEEIDAEQTAEASWRAYSQQFFCHTLMDVIHENEDVTRKWTKLMTRLEELKYEFDDAGMIDGQFASIEAWNIIANENLGEFIKKSKQVHKYFTRLGLEHLGNFEVEDQQESDDERLDE